ncbi:MAG: tetratricopeptide repeat protein [Gemmatimonadaceae bacterium]
MTWWVVGLILLTTLVAYSSDLNGPFVLDDTAAIQDNPTIRTLWPPAGTMALPTKGSAVAGRPVVSYTLALNYAVNRWLGVDQRADPDGPHKTVGYHVVNVMLHLLCGLLLFGVVRRTAGSGAFDDRWRASADGIAGAVAAVWLLLPIQTEAVDYVIQRTELIVSLCYLGTLYASIRAWDASSWRRTAGWYIVGVAVCLLGMGSKEVMFTAPLAVVLYDRAFRRGSFRQLVAVRGRLWFYVLLAATTAWLLSFVVRGARATTVGFGYEITWYRYLYSQAWAIAHYLRLTFWPVGLTLDYGALPVTGWRGIPGMILLAVLGIGSLAAWRRAPWLGFLGAWFFLLLAPSSSIVPITTEIAAERRIYLALAAVVVALVIGAEALRRRVAAGWNPRPVVVALAALLAMGTYARGRTYADAEQLWHDTVRKVPQNPRAWDNYGAAVLRENPRRLADAEAQFRQAIALDSSYVPAWTNLASVEISRDRLPDAQHDLERALALDAGYAHAVAMMGSVLEARGDPVAAIPYLERVAQNTPAVQDLASLGAAYMDTGRPRDAESVLRRAAAMDPTRADVMRSLGGALLDQNRPGDALPVLETATRLDAGSGFGFGLLALAYIQSGRSDDAERAAGTAASMAGDDAAALVFAGRAMLLARRPAEAARDFARAMALVPDDPEVITRYGIAEAAQGKLDEAGRLFRRALQVQPGYPPAVSALEKLARER